MSRRVRTALSRAARPVARPVAGALRGHPLVVPAVLFVLVLALGLSDVGRPGAPGRDSGSEAYAGLAGGRTLPTERGADPGGSSGSAGSEDDDAGGGAASSGLPTGGAGQLPRGGTTLFPRYRLVGYSGGPTAHCNSKSAASLRPIEFVANP